MTYIHKLKCLYCSLHFAVYSWHKDPPLKCPECGREDFVRWLEETEKPIYEFVPGDTPTDVEIINGAVQG